MFRTESQTKKLCVCPIGKVAHIIGDSTALIIVRDLFDGPKRFGDLVTSLSGISTRTITKKLKILEENEMILRTVISKKPPHVEYSLTNKGKGLKPVEEAMRRYGEKYL